MARIGGNEYQQALKKVAVLNLTSQEEQ